MMKKLLALTLSSTLILGACSIGTNQDNKEDDDKNSKHKSENKQTKSNDTKNNDNQQPQTDTQNSQSQQREHQLGQKKNQISGQKAKEIVKKQIGGYKGTGIDGVIKEDNSTYTVKTTGGSELGPAVSTAWVVDKKTGEIIKTYDVSTPQQKVQYQKKNEEMRKKVKEFDKMHEQTKKQNNSGQDSQQNEEEASQENTENVENQ